MLTLNEAYRPKNLHDKNRFNIKIISYKILKWTHRLFVKDYRAAPKLSLVSIKV